MIKSCKPREFPDHKETNFTPNSLVYFDSYFTMIAPIWLIYIFYKSNEEFYGKLIFEKDIQEIALECLLAFMLRMTPQSSYTLKLSNSN